MALVLTNDFDGRCDRYCESMNPPHVCVYAAEEVDETCDTQKTYACNEAITGTSDMLCKCVKQNAPAQCPKPAETTTPAPNNNRIKVSGDLALGVSPAPDEDNRSWWMACRCILRAWPGTPCPKEADTLRT